MAVVGPGRVGTALAVVLTARGHDVSAVAGRSAEALEGFRARIRSARIRGLEDVGVGADVVVLCVPDDALEQAVRRVAVADGAPPGSRWAHVAGSMGVDVLRPLRLAGAGVAACHPAVAFPDVDAGVRALPDATWAVTAASPDAAWAADLVRACGGVPVPVAEEARVRYHLALALASNAAAAVVALGRDLLLGAGVQDPAAFLDELVRASVADAAERGVAALPGPVRRGDAGTVARHLAELRTALPEALPTYVALARLQLGQARRAGADADAQERVAAVLDAAAGGLDAADAADSDAPSAPPRGSPEVA